MAGAGYHVQPQGCFCPSHFPQRSCPKPSTGAQDTKSQYSSLGPGRLAYHAPPPFIQASFFLHRRTGCHLIQGPFLLSWAQIILSSSVCLTVGTTLPSFFCIITASLPLFAQSLPSSIQCLGLPDPYVYLCCCIQHRVHGRCSNPLH